MNFVTQLERKPDETLAQWSECPCLEKHCFVPKEEIQLLHLGRKIPWFLRRSMITYVFHYSNKVLKHFYKFGGTKRKK